MKKISELIERLKFCWRVLVAKPGNLYSHARTELALLADDEMQTLVGQQLLELVLVFSTHGHSGFSASYAISMLENLLCFKPISPLTGCDYEWCEVSDGVYQNKRCHRVFKENGQAYDIDGKVFIGSSGGYYTNRDSRVAIVFPYTPNTEYVKVL